MKTIATYVFDMEILFDLPIVYRCTDGKSYAIVLQHDKEFGIYRVIVWRRGWDRVRYFYVMPGQDTVSDVHNTLCSMGFEDIKEFESVLNLIMLRGVRNA